MFKKSINSYKVDLFIYSKIGTSESHFSEEKLYKAIQDQQNIDSFPVEVFITSTQFILKNKLTKGWIVSTIRRKGSPDKGKVYMSMERLGKYLAGVFNQEEVVLYNSYKTWTYAY
jgi:hypothetical protein